ncbi:MAG: dihydrofolate reductase [Bacteroidota bacterium]|nr:dihydrofolate reductase [Bacteroidota bacterium]
MEVALIFAMDEKNAIGYKGKLPWHLPSDLKHFKEITTGHTVIMGRKTFESIGKPLKNRTNIIISRQDNLTYPGVVVKPDLKDALEYAEEKGESETFIIGGAELFKSTYGLAQKFYLTRIHHTFEADTFLPDVDASDWTIASAERHNTDEDNPYDHTFYIYEKR